LAIVSMILSMVPCMLLTQIGGLVTGVVALVKIKGSAGTMRGKIYAWTGVIISSAILSCFGGLSGLALLLALNQTKPDHSDRDWTTERTRLEAPLAPRTQTTAQRPGKIAAELSPPQVYRAYCLACHEANGRSQLLREAMPELPDFTAPLWQNARTDADVKESILNGKGKFMLPMKDKLSPTDADRMVAYVRAFQNAKQVVPLELQPPLATLYGQYCLACHGTDGKATAMRAQMPRIPDFSSRGFQDGLSNQQLVASILDGKGTLMPAYRGRVSDQQAQDLTAYVRTFGPAQNTDNQPFK